MIDTVTHSLFFYYPRIAGIPQIYKLNNEHDLEKYVKTHNGSPIGCHVSLYDVTSRPVIDKILFEFDGDKFKLQPVFEEVKTLIDEFKRKKLPYIPVFSGTKGFHIYLKLLPLEMDCETAKYVIRQIQMEFAGDSKYLDAHKVGVVRTQIRVPNTLNNSLFCVYLPPYFDELKISEILKLASQPHVYNYDMNCDKTALDLIDIHREVKPFNNIELPTVKAPAIPRLNDLIDIIRPCLFKAITQPEPPHAVRVSFVSELMWLGHTPEQIYSVCKQIRWRDFDPHKTRYQIEHIFRNKLLPHSCRRLRQFVDCSNNCGWQYDWGDNGEGYSRNGLSQEKFD